jgi:hypothetical protein
LASLPKLVQEDRIMTVPTTKKDKRNRARGGIKQLILRGNFLASLQSIRDRATGLFRGLLDFSQVWLPKLSSNRLAKLFSLPVRIVRALSGKSEKLFRRRILIRFLTLPSLPKILVDIVDRETAGRISANARILRFEYLESRALLTTLLYTPGAVANPIWTSNPNVVDWTDMSTGLPSPWVQNDTAQFPASGTQASPAVVDITGAGSQGLVYASEIIVENGANYQFAPLASAATDELRIDPAATGTMVNVGSSASVNFTAAIVSPSTTGGLATTGLAVSDWPVDDHSWHAKPAQWEIGRIAELPASASQVDGA